MKTVISSQEVYHRFANQVYGNARNSSGTVSYSTNEARSYNRIIGKLVTNAVGGETAFLIATYRYSKTTSAHIEMLRGSIPASAKKIFVENIGTPLDMIQEVIDSLPDMITKAQKARSRKADLIAEIQAKLDLIQELSTFFDQPIPANFVIPDEFSLQSVHEASYSHLLTVSQLRIQRQAELAAKYQADNQANILNAKNEVQRWIFGERNDFPWTLSKFLEYDYARIENGELVTTRGAKVPIDHASKACTCILKMLAMSKESGINISPTADIRLGVYRLECVKPRSVVIGCHNFEDSEIIRIAQLIGCKNI